MYYTQGLWCLDTLELESWKSKTHVRLRIREWDLGTVSKSLRQEESEDRPLAETQTRFRARQLEQGVIRSHFSLYKMAMSERVVERADGSNKTWVRSCYFLVRQNKQDTGSCLRAALCGFSGSAESVDRFILEEGGVERRRRGSMGVCAWVFWGEVDVGPMAPLRV